MKRHRIIAVDIGGSKIAWGLSDYEGKLTHTGKRMWDRYDSGHVLAVIGDIVQMLCEEAEKEGGIPDAIGVTIPGFADPAGGIWLSAEFMGIYHVPVAQILGERFHIPVYIENDTNACCLAEKLFGACREVNDFLYMTVSNGVGGAFFLDGKLYYGSHGAAGEYGMCIVKEGGRSLENRGYAGCLEMYASGRGLRQNYMDAGGLPLENGEYPDGSILAGRARKGDALANRVFDLEGYYLGKVIASACNLLDPEKVIIGGGLSLAFDCYEAALVRTLKEQHYKGTDYTTLFSVEPTKLGYDGGLYGAVSIAKLGMEPDEEKRMGYRGGSKDKGLVG